MINELLTTLMEDSMFVDIMTVDILDEGLFDKFKKKKEEPKSKDIDRSKLFNETVKVFKEELQKIRSKYSIKNSIYISYDKDDKKDFIDGDNEQLSFASYDLWKFSDNARDEKVNNEFWKYADEMTKNINDKISEYGGKLVPDGDWDTGSFYLEIK